MKRLFTLTFVLFFMLKTPGFGEDMSRFKQRDNKPSYSNVFGIATNAVGVPKGRIILIRKDKDYCAVKFPRYWTGKDPRDYYSSYESYYQGGKSGDFSNETVELREGVLKGLRGESWMGIGGVAGNPNFHCGPIILMWGGTDEISWVCFYAKDQDERDHGYELAPTNWTDISEVNVRDPRVKWYRFDAKRKETLIPVDKAWPSLDGEQKKDEKTETGPR
jgi:hypothetical protein